MKKIFTPLILAHLLFLQPVLFAETPIPSTDSISQLEQQLKQLKKKKTWQEKVDQVLHIAEKLLICAFLGTGVYLTYRMMKTTKPEKVTNLFAENCGEDVGNIDLNDYIGGTPPEVKNIVHFYKNPPTKFNVSLGGGILLYGDPGTGKTFLAKALAGELKKIHGNAVFLSVNGTDFLSKFVGSSEEMVRDLFNRAKKLSKQKNCPVIIFIDEIDSIGSKRSEDERNPTKVLHELLTQLEGFKQLKNIIVIGATNRPEMIDPALKRRLDQHIEVPLPTQEVRKELFEYYLKQHKPFQDDINLDELAVYKVSPAAIERTIKHAAETAAVENADHITFDHVINQLKKLKPLPEKECTSIPREDKITFDNVKGTIPREVHDLIRGIKGSSNQFNVSPSQGIIFSGPSGIGKTFFAHAIAGELDAEIIPVPAAQLTSWGSGSKAIKEIFEKAESKKPTILLIENIDVLCNTSPLAEPHALDQLLVHLDSAPKNIIVVGTTTVPDQIHQKLTRRLKIVEIARPNEQERIQLFNHYLGKHQPHDEININVFAKLELNPAQIEDIIKEAAHTAARDGASSITQAHIEQVLKQQGHQEQPTQTESPKDEKQQPKSWSRWTTFLTENFD